MATQRHAPNQQRGYVQTRRSVDSHINNSMLCSALYPPNIPKMAFSINTGFQNVQPFVVNEFIEHPDVGNTSNITIKKIGPQNDTVAADCPDMESLTGEIKFEWMSCWCILTYIVIVVAHFSINGKWWRTEVVARLLCCWLLS